MTHIIATDSLPSSDKDWPLLTPCLNREGAVRLMSTAFGEIKFVDEYFPMRWDWIDSKWFRRYPEYSLIAYEAAQFEDAVILVEDKPSSIIRFRRQIAFDPKESPCTP